MKDEGRCEKENEVRKAGSEREFVSLLSKVEFEEEREKWKNGKVSATCRFVPLRSQQKSRTQNFTLTREDVREERKGQEYQDETQLTLKDVYKKHVWGVELENKSPPKRMFQFEAQSHSDSKCLGHPLLQTYDDLVDYRSRVQEQRKISKIPFKVLDAPSLQDDFYLNLVDWSSQNVLAVALSSCVYLWQATTNKVVKFCDFGQDDMVCSLNWAPGGHQLAIGTDQGLVHLYDQVKMKKYSVIEGHSNRVGSLAWGNNALCSGSKDKTIRVNDLRTNSLVTTWQSHKQEVCGLKWSPDHQTVASGGNDNKLIVWKLGSDRPISKFAQHQAAVKALAWSPHRHGLLVSGGGTADRTIRFFNTLNS